MEQEHQSALRGKIDLRAILRLESGLHIGGASEFAPIGAVDSPFIRDPLTKKPIIPGSTIKGAMRTAILWRYLRDHPEQARRYWNGMRGLTRADRNSRRAQQAQVREMEQDILHVLGANAKKKSDAVNSAMRGLRLCGTDSMKRIVTLLASFAPFAGIGIKTALGMGAVTSSLES